MKAFLWFALVVVGSSYAFGQSSTPTTGGSDRLLSYGIIVDNSGSVRPYLDALILTTKSIVRRNKAKDETFLVRFINRNNVQRMQGLTQDAQKIAVASEDFFSEGGQTAIIDALFQSSEYLAASAIKNEPDRRLALILISDGEDRESRHKYEELSKFAIENKISIYTMGFSKLVKRDQGKKAYEAAVTFLQKLSTDTGGQSFFPTTAAELDKSLDEIFASARK